MPDSRAVFLEPYAVPGFVDFPMEGLIFSGELVRGRVGRK